MLKSENDALVGAIFNAKRSLENALKWNKDPPIILQCHDVQSLVKAADELLQLKLAAQVEKTDQSS